MPYLILIRHSISQPIPGISAHEWQLTSEGQTKCQQLARRLEPYRMSQLFHSSEPKAVDTAAAVGKHMGVPYEFLDGLHETKRTSAPYFADRYDFETVIHAAMAQPDKCLFGEEPFSAALSRFEDTVNLARAQFPGETIGLVSHGTVLSLYLAAKTGLPAFDLWKLLDMPAFASLTLPDFKLCELCVSLPE